MKRISFCGESFLTTDGAADALLRLVIAFPSGHDSELLKLPAVNNDGEEMVVQIIVGPGSELISVPEESTWREPDTLEAVAYLHRRIQTLRTSSELTFSEAPSFMEYEWDTEYLL